MTISFKEEKFNPWNDTKFKAMHNIYRVRIDRNHKTMTFNFTDSAHNYETGKRPTAYDILACLIKYDCGNYLEFCNEFGYEPYDFDFDYIVVNGNYYNRKNYKTWKAVTKEYNNVMRLFGDCIDELAEIN